MHPLNNGQDDTSTNYNLKYSGGSYLVTAFAFVKILRVILYSLQLTITVATCTLWMCAGRVVSSQLKRSRAVVTARLGMLAGYFISGLDPYHVKLYIY